MRFVSSGASGKGKGGGEIPSGDSCGGHRGIEHPCGGQFLSDLGGDLAPEDFATAQGVKSDFPRIVVALGAFAPWGGDEPSTRCFIGFPLAFVTPSDRDEGKGKHEARFGSGHRP